MKHLLEILSATLGKEDVISTDVGHPSALQDAEYFLRIAVMGLKEAAARLEASKTSAMAATTKHGTPVSSLSSEQEDGVFLNQVYEDIRVAAKTVKGIRKRFASHVLIDGNGKQAEGGWEGYKSGIHGSALPSAKGELERKMRNSAGASKEDAEMRIAGRKRERKGKEYSDEDASQDMIGEKDGAKEQQQWREKGSPENSSTSIHSRKNRGEDALDLGQYVNQKDVLFGGNDAKKNKFARLMGGAKALKEGGGDKEFSHHDTVGKTSKEIKKINEDLEKEYDYAIHHKSKKGLGA